MKTKIRKQNISEVISKMSLPNENIGVLTPVHIDDIIKQHNLDYLESLGELVQRTRASPMWFQYQSPENILKFLQIYQLSINYVRNTQQIYNSIQNELDKQFTQRRNKVNKLKAKILADKQKTQKLKKCYRKKKLLKQKEKVLKYQKNIRNLRDSFIKQKKQLQAKNQRLIQEERLKQQQQMYENQKDSAQYNQKYSPYNYAPPYQYHHPHHRHLQYQNHLNNPHVRYVHPPPQQNHPYYQNVPNQNNYTKKQNPPSSQKNQFQQPSPQNILKMFNLKTKKNQNKKNIKQEIKNQKKKNIKQEIKNQQQYYQQQQFEEIPPQQQVINKKNIPKTSIHRKLAQKDEIRQSIKLLKKQSNRSIKQSKRSQTNSVENKNSNKAWTLGNSNNIIDSVFESQKGDVVTELQIHTPISTIQKKSIQNHRISKRKQSDIISEDDVNSMINIQLKTQSHNDLNEKIQKKKGLKHTISIVEDIQNQVKKKNYNPNDYSSQEQFYNKEDIDKNKRQTKAYGNKIQIKILKQNQSSPNPMDSSMAESRTYDGYLQQSNQGVQIKAVQYLDLKNIKMKDNTKINHSTNSLQDNDYKNQSRLYIEDNSQNDLQIDNLALTTNTKAKVQLEHQNEQKKKIYTYLNLYKNTFTLKQDVISFNQSKSSSGIGSLKQFSVKFIGSQKKKGYQDKSQQGFSDYGNDMMEMIEMPMDSRIAKPSKNKQSTIKKSIIQQKIHKSYDPKSNDSKPGQFILETPQRHVNFASKDNIDDNFAKIPVFQDLVSVNVRKNNQLLKPTIASKPEQKLKMSITQSHVIDQDIAQNKESQREDPMQLDKSINLTVIQQSQNQSLITQNSVKQKILLLINRKYRQKGAFQFNTDIIVKQIKLAFNKKQQQLNQEQIIDKFSELAKNKQAQILALKERIKKRGKKSQQNSRQPSVRIQKQQKNSQIKKSTIQQNKQDDLTYSTSMLQNPPLQILKIQMTESAIYKKDQNINKSTIKKSQKKSQPQIQYGKFIRQQQSDNKNNTKQLSKLAQVSYYNQDDQVQNAVKIFAKVLQTIKEKDADDDENF